MLPRKMMGQSFKFVTSKLLSGTMNAANLKMNTMRILLRWLNFKSTKLLKIFRPIKNQVDFKVI